MPFIPQLRLGPRITAVFVCLAIFAGTLAILGAREIAALTREVGDEPARTAMRASLATWKELTSLNAARTAATLQSGDVSLADRLAPAMKASTEKINALSKTIETSPLSAAQRQRLESIAPARKAYIAVREDILKARRAGDPSASAAYEQRFVPALDAYIGSVDAFVAGHEAELAADNERAVADARHATLMLSIVGALMGLAAVVLGYRLTRSIVRPLREAVALANAVASGDLTRRVETTSNDELGELVAALGRMNDSLVGIVGGVRDGTDTISTASKQIAVGNQDLSQRTEEQAASLEETASSMEELTSTMRQSAQSAQQANQLAVGASEVAARGGDVVRQVVETMSGISSASRKIADITGVIDGIAFQTNILALNAAVEAARAGEQGRGFAVVATEVRNLAQRSAAAAKQIKALIDDSADQVETGARQVDRAGETMREVVDAIGRVADMMAEIDAASREQSSGIDQINQAVTQMDEVTQQNAALVEEAAAAALSMEEQAAQLAAAVAVFKVDRATVVPPPSKRATGAERRGPWRARNVLSRRPTATVVDAADETTAAFAAG